jgi:tetratricopeptide (TPR) repeat protein
MRKNLLAVLIVPVIFFLCAALCYHCTTGHSENKKLNQLYRDGLKVAYNRANPFCPQAELDFCDSVLSQPSTSPATTMYFQYEKAIALVKLGDEKKAIDLFQALMQDVKVSSGPDGRLSADLRNRLALAWVRLGERNNCISNHSVGSCIFPIQGKGVYTDPYASQKGIELYQQILQQDPGDLTSRWMLNIAYMTLGEYPAKVPAEWLIPGLDIDTSSVKVLPFRDMAGSLKLSSNKNMAGGTIIDDFNNDGYLDIITSCWDLEESMHYYKNNGDGTFTDVSKQSGLADIKGGLNIIQADYNNDGFTDILILRGAWLREMGKQPATLLRNNGNGTFTDVTVESGILSFGPTQTGVWADFNNDGWLDLFIAHETGSPEFPHPSQLYINNHDGTFTDVTEKSGCDKLGFTKGVVAADYNNDGWPDIFMSGLDGHKILLKNKGIKSNIPQFEDATHEAGLDKDTTFTFPTWFFDYDNDGWPDIFVCGYNFQGHLAQTLAEEALHRPLSKPSAMYLYRNNHDGTFTNVSKSVGLDHPVFAMGANFGDIDNDGWLDMYLATGNPDFTSLIPNKMYKNIGGQRFADVTSSARVGNLQKGHAVSFADIDNDGDQDLFVETGGAFKGDAFYNSLYINPGQNNNNWISVLLEGVHSNRSAIGAHIAVTFTEDGKQRTVYRDVNSGGSFGASPLRQQIGIGTAKMIDELIIKWPTTGIVQVFKNVSPRQFLRIKEGSDQIEKINLKTLQFKDSHEPMNMNMSMDMSTSLINFGPAKKHL